MEASDAPGVSDLLDLDLRELDLPARVWNLIERRDLRTLRDLVALDPHELTQVRNLGRKSIADIRALIEARLGTTWERAAAGQLPAAAPTPPSPEPPTTPPRTWADLARWVPPALRGVGIDDVPGLPTRLLSFAKREGVTTLGALVDVPEATVYAAPNLGRKSFADAVAAVVTFVAQPAEEVLPAPSLDADSGLLAFWRTRAARLDAIDRLVLQHRAGLGTAPLTLLEVGELLGCTREWVRQIESRGLGTLTRDRRPFEAIEARLHALLEEGARPVDALVADDPWFAALRDDRAFAGFFLERVLEGRCGFVTLDGVDLIATFTEDALRDAWATLDRSLRATPWPAPRASVETRVAEAAAPFGRHGLGCFTARVATRWIVDGANSDRVLGYGDTRGSEIEAFLRGASGPVTVSEIARRFGRGHLPEGVVLLDRGVVTLDERLDSFDAWGRRLVPRCERWMRDHGPERQWSCAELAAVVADEPDLPPWFGPWPLAAMCERSDRVRYIGRLAVVLPEVEGERLHVLDALIQVLTEAAGPVPEAELRARATRRRGFGEFTITITLQRRPFIETSRDVWGLRPRDLPDGETAAARAVEWTVEALEARGCGLTLDDCLGRLRARSGAFDDWTTTMLRSVFRDDARLQTSVQGAVGLADWDDVRLPSRRDVIAQCLDEGGGRALISTLQTRIAALYGDHPSRDGLAWSGWGLGAHLVGDELVRRGVGDDAPRVVATLPGIPPQAAGLFESLRTEDAGDLDALSRAVDAHARRFFHEAVTSEAIDLTSVLAAQRASHTLLALARDAGPEARQTAAAAVRYFLHEDDGAWDFTVDGLVDDLAVLDAALTSLRAAGREEAAAIEG